MTGNEILTTFETFVGDALDPSIELSLANQARTEIETELRLQCSKKLDTSQTVQSGSTYTTAYTLVADILVPVGPIIYVDETPYTGIPFEQREIYKDRGEFWYVNLNAGTFHLCGTPQAGETITFPYITKGTDIAADGSTVLKYPSGLHIIVPMHMARIWFAIDAGEKGRSWLPEWEAFYQRTKNAIIDWDHQWKLASIGGATPYGESHSSSVDTLDIS